MRNSFSRFALFMMIAAGGARAADNFTVEIVAVQDETAVFATVESRSIIAARIRTPGTIASLSVHEGDLVKRGQVIATVADPRLRDQADALDAQIVGLKAQEAQTIAELARHRALLVNGVTSQSDMDGLSTAASLATAAVKARQAERRALGELIAQGNVLAPDTGQVLSVPVAEGAVVMAGETLATVARRARVLRLLVPESQANGLTLGEAIRIEGVGLPGQGIVSRIYPQIQDGRVVADLTLPDSDSSFVGQRVRAWVHAEPRAAIAIPPGFLTTRFGIDFVHLRLAGGAMTEVTVQRGHPVRLSDQAEAVEILSGLVAGDVLVPP